MRTLAYFLWLLFFLISSMVVEGTTDYLISTLGILVSVALLTETEPPTTRRE